ncbi:TLD-domain-containing protein [Multifurca ochricompacta]|uniref:Oxidation resistance protein 1 n=1 Tax=Multifurca ochricompacta TaxID=376703 RepID=A0AAD4QKZ2_9AGAM|nr:TLD-domain-containing protein [Multifurca ochricompacta]
MYWHKREQQHPSSSPSSSSSRPASAIQSGATTPQPRQAPQPQPPPEPELTTGRILLDDGILGGELSDEPPPVEMNVGMRVGMGVDVDADVTNVTVEPLMEALSEAVSDNTFAVSAIPLVTRHHQHHLAKTTRDRAESDSIIIAPSSTSTSTRRRPGVHPPSPITRSPSLPPSSPPSRPSPPVLTRTESISTFMSRSGSGSGLGSGSGSGSGSAGAGLGLVGGGSWSGSSSLPSRWVTSFLTYRGPPLPLSQAPTTAPGIPPHSSIPKRSVTDITHGSPFAATPFVPASGAPGFDGDRKWNKKGFEVTGDDGGGGGGALDDRRAVQLLGRKESTRVVLETALANTLRSHLPARARLPRSWTLLFSLDQHGISLQTLYARCSAATSSSSTATTTTTTSATPSHSSGALLVVCDAEETRFGAWIADGIREGHGSYTGSGESFLWKVHEDGVKVFKWTGKNDYVALCEPESISFGGGDGHYGLYLDETLYEGSSARCLTFNNEPLCAFSQSQSQSKVGGGGGIGTVRFECVGLEVWGVSS